MTVLVESKASEATRAWDADWELFHDHPRGAPCSCYVRVAAVRQSSPLCGCGSQYCGRCSPPPKVTRLVPA